MPTGPNYDRCHFPSAVKTVAVRANAGPRGAFLLDQTIDTQPHLIYSDRRTRSDMILTHVMSKTVFSKVER